MLVVRSAGEADNLQIRKLVRTSLADFNLMVEFDGLDAAIGSAGLSTSKNLIELVAELDQQVCGCIALEAFETVNAQEAKVFGFHVDDHYRGKGIGRSLLTALMSEAKQRGLKTLYLDTWDNMHSAIRLYESLGWMPAPDPAPESGANRSYVFTIS